MAPVDGSPTQQSVNNFELIHSLKVENTIPVFKYKSKKTGLSVVLADVEGPTVNGYFCLATEAFDDDGLPHTLEHLIFLGSETYPYKGILDLVANRCLARGTNAWTDTDHTCYTISTAGSEGFLSMLPIYLDHILYPTLTDHAFVTEVHHVTGDGNDAGVVYCEMQARENDGESRAHLEMLREIYPGKCGYKSETGGILKNLRESTTNEKCVNFHKEYYRPENLVVIITGPVNHLDVFKAIEQVENKIISKNISRDDYVRPWQSPVPPLTEAVEKTIKFPTDDETNGLIYIGWRGPSAVTEIYELNACALILKYLTDTAVSILQREFVEIEDPYASNIAYSLIENAESVVYLGFESVPTDKIELIKPKLVEILEALVSGKEPLDMERLQTVIHRYQLERLSHLENSPHEAIAFMIIGDFLYGRDVDDFKKRLNTIEDLRRLQSEPVDFWLNLLEKYFVDSPMITIKAYPSVEEQKKMIKEETRRIEAQIKQLGDQGLKEKMTVLNNAISYNSREPPVEMVRSVPIPGTDTIQHHKIVRYTTDSGPCPQFDLNKIPIYAHIDHVNTNFVYMYLLMDTSDLPLELRNYLSLYLEAILESPVARGDTIISYEEIVSQLEADTVSIGTRIGLDDGARFSCGPFSQTASIVIQLEEEKYEKGITWLNELLYKTVFTVDRLKVLCSKLINDVSQVKRSGSKVVRNLMKDIFYTKDSNWYSNSLLRQHLFLTEVLEKLNDGRADSVLSGIEKLRQILTAPKNMVIHLALNLDHISQKISDPATPWENLLLPNQQPIKHKLHITPDWKVMVKSLENITKPNCVVGLGSLESAFLITTTPCVKSFTDPDLVPILVFLAYITQLEGPMWRQVRGPGLTYSYRLQPFPNEGLLYFILTKATNVTEAFKVSKKLLEEHINMDSWDENLMASAKSSLVFEIIQREQNIGDVVAQSMLSYFKGVDEEYNRNLLQLINKVTVDDLKMVGKKYIKHLFDPKKSKTTIVCNPGMIEKVLEDLKECNIDFTAYTSLEKSFLNQW